MRRANQGATLIHFLKQGLFGISDWVFLPSLCVGSSMSRTRHETFPCVQREKSGAAMAHCHRCNHRSQHTFNRAQINARFLTSIAGGRLCSKQTRHPEGAISARMSTMSLAPFAHATASSDASPSGSRTAFRCGLDQRLCQKIESLRHCFCFLLHTTHRCATLDGCEISYNRKRNANVAIWPLKVATTGPKDHVPCDQIAFNAHHNEPCTVAHTAAVQQSGE
jgi:hypothetical protein